MTKHKLQNAVLSAIIVVSAIGWSAASNVTHAAGPFPVAMAESPYQSTGTVDYVDMRQNIIVVSDVGLGFSGNVTVHTGKGTTSIHALYRGVPIGYNAVESDGRMMVTEIWLLR